MKLAVGLIFDKIQIVNLMTEVDRNENMRQMLELALTYGRKYKSAQTGYLHYCYSLPEEVHLPIPIAENFLYALALFRTRLTENINEAKGILDGLFHFQNTNENEMAFGNFPIYLHEYPVCKDRFLGLQVGLPLYWILKNFHQILGQDLKKRVEKTLVLLIKQSLKTHSERPATYPTAVKLASIAKAGGVLLQNQEFIEAGDELLKELIAHPDLYAWFCPSSMGTMLTGLMLVYNKLSESPWKRFWEHLQQTWHRRIGCYIGPALKEWQQGGGAQVTVYDLCLSYFSGSFSARILRENPAHLETTLIPFSENVFSEIPIPFSLEGQICNAKWTMYHGTSIAYSVVDTENLVINPIYEKGFHPLRVIWSDSQQIHSLVFQGLNHKIIKFAADNAFIDIFVKYNQTFEEESREGAKELTLFMDAHEGIEFLVSGERSSTFMLGEEVSIKSGPFKCILKFTQTEGTGRFLGHRMMANRPSQMDIKGSKRFNAYDWQISLRTIQRTENTSIHIRLQF